MNKKSHKKAKFFFHAANTILKLSLMEATELI
jgi:hypothetical protein